MSNPSLLFLRLRWLLLRNFWLSMRRRHPLAKLMGVAGLVALLWGALFALFYVAFKSLGAEYADFRLLMLAVLFAVFFLLMFLLLSLSNAVFSYVSLSRSWETDFLHATPLSPASIFWHRTVEALGYSLWAAFLLCLPLVAAFGLVTDVPWYFYPLSGLFFLTFVSIAVHLGAIGSLLFVNHFLPSRRRLALLALVFVGVFLFLAAGELVRQRWTESGSEITRWLEGPLARLNMAQNAFLPSMWLSDGLLLSAQGRLPEALFALCLLGGNALFFGMVAYLLAEYSYERAYHTAQDHISHHRPSARRWVYRFGGGLLGWLSPMQKQIILKDLKVFLRSPVQWSQVLIFLGILAIYFINVQHFQKGGTTILSGEVGSFVNLVSIVLTLCTFTVRFAYPMISLEGPNFWILGMAPIPRRSVLEAKFIAILAASLLCGIPLVLLSDLSLKLGGDGIALHLIAVTMVCFGLTALSVGLGAVHLALHEVNPAKIVAGLGGTVNLVVSLGFTAVVLLFFALPYHVGRMGILTVLWDWRAYTSFGVVALTVALCMVMRYIGARALDRLDLR